MAARRIVYLASLGAALVFYTAYGEWFSWFTLILILLLPWFSFLLSLPAMLRFRVEIIAPDAVCIGEMTQVRLLGRCRLPVPPFRGRISLKHHLTALTRVHRTEMELPTDHCGAFTVCGEKVRVFDYLGLFALRVRGCTPHTILVRPRPIPMPDVQIPENLLVHAWKPKPGGGFSENHELRQYRPGDNLNQVHWKLTAKTGKLIIREPMQPERTRVAVTMNLRGTPEVLDRKFGRFLWLGQLLLGKNIHFEAHVLTAQGVQVFPVTSAEGLCAAIDSMLCAEPVQEGDLRDLSCGAVRRYHIGGEPDET